MELTFRMAREQDASLLLDFIKEQQPSFSLSVYKENRRALEFYLREGLTITAEGMDEATGHEEYTLTWNSQGA